MDNIYKYIVENLSLGKVEKQTAIQILSMLKQKEAEVEEKKNICDIAIIGLSAKFPMADNADEFWNNIKHGIDCNQSFPESRRKDIDDYLNFKDVPVNEMGYLEASYFENVDGFDYSFFQISPKEASLMDPNQRLFLQTVWKAIEDSGYGGRKLSGTKTGVYVGFYSNIRDNYQKIINEVEPDSIPISMTGNLSAMLPSRISYLLDLRGPTMVVDTACSSSLVAVDLACQAIKSGQCEMAIAGGVKINTVPLNNENEKIGIESSDGRTRTLDDNSDGAGVGEGVAAIILKPLSQAIKDGDSIYAVIKGSATNQDGTSIGLTAPNPAAQAAVIEEAWKNAGIAPDTISYIEVHGTATNLGDPIEIKGIQGAFRKYTNKRQFCALSCVKTNMGHLFEAAGIASMVKAIMALKNKLIPPSIYFNKPNRTILFEDSPVYINNRLRNWDCQDGVPRRCGVSSFGFSGTNCHVILEEAPKIESNAQDSEKDQQIIVMSAKSSKSLQQLVLSYIKYLGDKKNLSLRDICYTANTGRGHYTYRVAFIVKSIFDFKSKLSYILTSNFEISECEDIFYGVSKPASFNELSKNNINAEEENKKLDDTAKSKMGEFIETNQESKDIMREICSLYVQGADIDWDILYKGESLKRFNLPVYCFDEQRCWINIPKIKRKEIEEDMFYSTVWQRDNAKASSAPIEHDNIMVMKDSSARDLGKEIIERLRSDGKDVIEVEFSKGYKEIDNNRFQAGWEEKDYINLVKSIKTRKVSCIVHLCTVTDIKEINSTEELEESQRRGVYSVYNLIKGLVLNGITEGLDIVLVSDYVNKVTGEESRIKPENATLFGIGRVAEQEHPGFRFRCIDIDDSVPAETIVNELKTEQNLYQVAYRDGVRYSEELKGVKIENNEQDAVELKDTGVYIIAGGAGGMGLELAKDFAKRVKINVALINRSPIPPQEEWDAILQKGDNKKLCSKIAGIKKIQELGADVTYYTTDISNMESMSELIDNLRSKYGRINGIINAAGIVDAGFIIRKPLDSVRKVLDPKVMGSWVLDRLTRQDNPDFFMMFSSGLSMIGEPGMSGYVAANSFLDSYAAYRAKMSYKTQTINWVSWKEVGMSVEHRINVDKIFKAIPTDTAISCFTKVLNSGEQRVLIGQLNNDADYLKLLKNVRIRMSSAIWEKIKASEEPREANLNDIQESQTGEIKLKGKNEGEYTEIEGKLAKIFRQVLGFDEINIYDSFFELGGDSILLGRMHLLIEKEFPGKVKITELFEFTSIYRLAEHIMSQCEKVSRKEEDDEEEELLKMFEDIESGNVSIDDAIKRLK